MLEPPPPAPGSDSSSSSGSYSNSISPSPFSSALSIEPTTVEETDTLVSDLEKLHVSVVEIDQDILGAAAFMAPPTPVPTPASTQATESKLEELEPESEPFVGGGNDGTEEEGKSGDNDGDDDDDDVFPTPSIPATKPSTRSLDKQNNLNDKGDRAGEDDGKRIIVEALVVRKMSLEEAFLDFGTFA
ncbi:hypothetical protein AX14_013911 [Amanita brunnescens Koide BX004]|nr:hypothetical protein AX14_013911 [Amanita brunnescens Koide BX004]